MDSSTESHAPSGMEDSLPTTGKRSNGRVQRKGNPTVNAVRTKVEAKTGSWPMVTTGLSTTRNISYFNIQFWKYLRLCVDVYDVLSLSLRRHEKDALPLNHFVYFMVFALARRVFDLVAGFGDIPTDESMDAPILSKTMQIPRPIYCYLACIGDLRVGDLNLNIRPLLDLSTVKALIYCAKDIRDLQGDAAAIKGAIETFRLKTRVSPTQEVLATESMQHFLTRFFQIDCEVEGEAKFAGFIRSCYAFKGVEITWPRARAIRDLITGWIADPPFDENGVYERPAGYGMMDLGVNDAIEARMAELHETALIYQGYAQADRKFSADKALKITASQIDVLDRIRQCYVSSNGTPTSLNGSPCQLMTQETLASGGFVISSPLPASGTHLGMGVVCKFNPIGDLPLESCGYTTVLQADQPNVIVHQWIASNKLANRPK